MFSYNIHINYIKQIYIIEVMNAKEMIYYGYAYTAGIDVDSMTIIIIVVDILLILTSIQEKITTVI